MPHGCIYGHGFVSKEADEEELHTIQGIGGLQLLSTHADFCYHHGGSIVSHGGTTPVRVHCLVHCPGQSGTPWVQSIS